MDAPPREPGRPALSPAFWHAAACVCLAILAAGTFANALNNEFVDYDDWFLVVHNDRIRSLDADHILDILVYRSSHGTWLPLRELSYSVDYAVWGLNPFGFHVTNVVLHTANAVLVYALMHWLLGRKPLAWLATAWFAVHPVQVESVTWVSGRRDVLYAFLFLLAFLAFVRALRRRRQVWACVRDREYIASIVLLALALMAKASAMMLPAVLALVILLRGEDRQPGWEAWERLALCVPHMLVALAMVAIHFALAHDAEVVKGNPLGQRLASMPWTFATYWRLLFFPVQLATPHSRVPLSWPAEAATIVVCTVVAVGVVVAAWWVAPRRSVGLFCLGWWFAMLFPVSGLVPISMLAAERYLYLPLVGACAFGADLVGSLWSGRRRWVVGPCVAATLVLFGAASWHRNTVWRTSCSFWEDGVSKWPGSPVTRCGLAAAALETNAPELAYQQYLKIIEPGGMAYSENKEHTDLVKVGLLECYDRVARRREAEGKMDEALKVYELVVRQMPRTVGPRVRLAEAYERHGLLDKALEALDHLAELQEDYPGLAEWRKRLDAKKAGKLPAASPD